MATTTEINTWLQEARCNSCIPKGEQLPVIIYLLQQLAENTMTPNELMAAAKCNRCIPVGEQLPVVIYLLDALVNGP